jgi:OFA family oxalate/formate antiporter-like MFS transporter
MTQTARVPARAWLVAGAGTAVNLCLGILYAWSVWKASLIASKDHPAGSPMTGLDAGWTYLSDAEATWAYAICGFTFALFMIPGAASRIAMVPAWVPCWVASVSPQAVSWPDS